MNILTLICLLILSLVSVLALVVSMLGGFFLGRPNHSVSLKLI